MLQETFRINWCPKPLPPALFRELASVLVVPFHPSEAQESSQIFLRSRAYNILPHERPPATGMGSEKYQEGP